MDELKPCPFCGGKAKIIYPSNTLKPTLIHVSEKACYANGWREYDTEAEAIEAWNTRAERTCELTLDGTDGCFGCSECYENIPPLANYCPNCGAKVVSE